MISVKNILQGDFEGKKFGQCKTQAVDHQSTVCTLRCPLEEKSLSRLIIMGKKKYYNIVCWGKRIVSPEMWRKKVLTQTKSKPKTQTKSVKVVL